MLETVFLRWKYVVLDRRIARWLASVPPALLCPRRSETFRVVGARGKGKVVPLDIELVHKRLLPEKVGTEK